MYILEDLLKVKSKQVTSVLGFDWLQLCVCVFYIVTSHWKAIC